MIAADGTVAAYDRLLLATGSTPVILPVFGKDLPGVITYRDIADTDAMIDAAKEYRHAVVIGGGLLGLEAANGLAPGHGGDGGSPDAVADGAPARPHRGQPVAEVAGGEGSRFRLEAKTEALVAARAAVSPHCVSRRRNAAADLVVMAVGIRPNVKLAQEAGLHCDRGIVVNDTLQTFDPRIYAIGECVGHRGSTYGLVAPLFEMAKVCANHLAQRASAATSARRRRPSSRSPASISFRLAISPAAPTPRKSSCPIPRAASTRSSC